MMLIDSNPEKMSPPSTKSYIPVFQEGSRIRLNHENHLEHSHAGTVKRILENPSQRKDSQWYDVQFDSRRWGRFLERFLRSAETAAE